MNRYKKLCRAADRAEEAYRKFAPEGGEFPNTEECRKANINSIRARERIQKYEQIAILMHEDLTSALEIATEKLKPEYAGAGCDDNCDDCYAKSFCKRKEAIELMEKAKSI